MNASFALQDRFIDKIRLFPHMLEPLPWDEIRTFFHALARALLARIKPD
jgi:hypothetical protein